MTTTDILRAVADLLEGLPGLPPPTIWVSPSVAEVGFHQCDAVDMRARITAAEVVLAVTGGEPRPQASGSVSGEVPDWHGTTLRVIAHSDREQVTA